MLVPLGLVVGFVIVFGILFGERLVPSVPVEVAPVVTVRNSGDNASVTRTQTDEKQLLFQASGWIEPDPFPISVSTLVSGIVEEVFVLEGELVEQGQKLVRLNTEDARLDLEAAQTRVATLKAEIESERARLAMVKSDQSGETSGAEAEKYRLAELEDKLDRLYSLPEGSIPDIELTATRMQVDQQKAKLEKAGSAISSVDSEVEMIRKNIQVREHTLKEAQVKLARAQLALDRHVIHSPVAGRILELHVAPGIKRMLLMDNPKSGYIVELFDPESLQARIDVPLSEAAGLSVGQPVEMSSDLLPDLILNGIVTRINGVADIQRNTLQVKVAIENPDDRLRPEMLVRGKFFSPPASPGETNPAAEGRGGRLSLYLPEQAIFDEDKVWVVSAEGRAEQVTVELGVGRRDDHRQVLSGVLSGQKVILPPYEDLKQGTRIAIQP